MKTVNVTDEFECQLECLGNHSCKSFNVHSGAGKNANRICELNNETRRSKPGDFKKKKGSNYYGSVQVSVRLTVFKLTQERITSSLAADIIASTERGIYWVLQFLGQRQL